LSTGYLDTAAAACSIEEEINYKYNTRLKIFLISVNCAESHTIPVQLPGDSKHRSHGRAHRLARICEPSPEMQISETKEHS
jgi:hypothetical protein